MSKDDEIMKDEIKSPWHDPNAELADLARDHLYGCRVFFDDEYKCVRVQPQAVWIGGEIAVKRHTDGMSKWEASLRFGPNCSATDSTPARAIMALATSWFNFDRGVEVLRISRVDQVCRLVSDGLSISRRAQNDV